MAASATKERPLTTWPSTGIRLPGRMRTTSPGRMVPVGTSRVWPSRMAKSEILSLLPELLVLHHQERPVGERGVVEYVGKKPAGE
jgi:hypothetical protein